MRSLVPAWWMLIAACAAGPRPISVDEVVGPYRFTIAPDHREEFCLEPGGQLLWRQFSNAMLRERQRGHWDHLGDEIIIDIPAISFALPGARATLALRRFADHVYLVPKEQIDWFDEHGPMEEFCLSREGAPLVDRPGYSGTAARVRAAGNGASSR